jgi:hypothetical protein
MISAGDTNGCARSLVWPITTICGNGKCINNTCICNHGWSGLGELQDRRGYDCHTNVSKISQQCQTTISTRSHLHVQRKCTIFLLVICCTMIG